MKTELLEEKKRDEEKKQRELEDQRARAASILKT
jgi:hypothetical protein